MEGPIVRVPSHINVGGARQIARLKKVGCLLVSEGQRILGLLSTDDWNRAPDDDPVWKWMRRSMGGIRPDTDVREALTAMVRQGTSFLVVSAGALVLGVVTEQRLRHALGTTEPAPATARVPTDFDNDGDDLDDDLPWAAAG
jgi:predicted transcriptional regulator